jgi:tRNA-dihydrouridine synthase
MDTGIIPPKPTVEELCNTIIRHAKLELQYKDEYIAVREMRKHVAWYTAEYPHSAKLRQEINNAESFKELEKIVQGLTLER